MSSSDTQRPVHSLLRTIGDAASHLIEAVEGRARPSSKDEGKAKGKGPLSSFAHLLEEGPAALDQAVGKLAKGELEALSRKHGSGDVSYDYDFIAPLGMLKGVPWHALPTLEWVLQVGVVAIRILANGRAVHEAAGGADLAPPSADHHMVLRLAHGAEDHTDDQLQEQLRSELEDLKVNELHTWIAGLFESLRTGLPPLAADPGLEPYQALFQRIKLPAIAHTFDQDSTFARLRVAGPNPTSLFGVQEALPANFPVTEAQYKGVMGDEDSLADALAEHRLYMVDYRGVEPTLNGSYPSSQKYGAEPMALFAVPSGSYSPRPMVPVAVQCGQDPATYPVLTPADGQAWRRARTVVEAADGTFHELVAHLGRTHLVVEPFPVATQLHLSEGHPLRTLLMPHFEGTLFINWAAGAFLTAPKNFVDSLLSGTIDADRTTSVQVTASRGFNASFLPRWLADQGTDDPALLPVYPFRDDAMRLWRAIHSWAEAYVGIYWPTDEAVQQDTELQAWATGVAAFDGGRVPDFGETPTGAILSATYLAEAVTMVIFTGSAMHAAVNFPQGDIMDYAPAQPFAGYNPVPVKGQEVSYKDWLDSLPGVDEALTQLNILYLLGNVYHTRLGQYADGTFTDGRVLAALADFQAALERIEEEIKRDNLSRSPAYEYLLPSRIPQSINI